MLTRTQVWNRTPRVVRQGVRSTRRFMRAPAGVPIQECVRLRPRQTVALARVVRERLSYSSTAQLVCLAEAVRHCEHAGVEGEIIEAGCALGGTSIVMCAVKAPARQMRIFDVFGMIPPPSADDGDDLHERYDEISSGRATGLGGRPYYAYDDDLMTTVERNFVRLGYPLEKNHVTMTRGKVEDLLVVDGPVSVANIDVDWYVPVRACLARVIPNLSIGGTAFVRAYGDWSSSGRATDEFFREYGWDDFERSQVDGGLRIHRIR